MEDSGSFVLTTEELDKVLLYASMDNQDVQEYSTRGTKSCADPAENYHMPGLASRDVIARSQFASFITSQACLAAFFCTRKPEWQEHGMRSFPSLSHVSNVNREPGAFLKCQ